MRSITETFLLSDSDTDVLKAPSRLSAVPDNAILFLEVSANVAVAANHAMISVTTPDGELPIEGQIIPASGLDTTNAVLYSDTKVTMVVPVQQGGHVLVSLGIMGTCQAYIKATLVWG